ncbi:MAG: hypothetical protein KatS3mg015_2107 [Fimbriimonadales bacterium]|nr:MAG: hypothetical protein KatS3mg015_2107 [Fimbriimonadales bacterium]
MKYGAWLAVFLVSAFALAISSCGGGSGEGGGGGNVTFFLVRVELPGKDPLNIESGTGPHTFELAGYVQGTGQRVKLTPTSWTLEEVQGDVGTLNSANGSFTPGSQGTAYVNVVWNGSPTPVRLQIAVRPAGLARLTGDVIGGGGTTAGTIVAFYDASNNEVGRATVMSNGKFTGLVPNTATKINVPVKASGYYPGEWTYNGDTYSWNVQNCHAPMVLNQPLQSGQTSTLVGAIGLFVQSQNSPPPPPPTGCSG